jgi:predicted MFS family arabinose efflux permease
MSIGASIFLIALGLILALAVNVDLSGIDVQTIGWILTLVGIGGLVLSLTIWNRRRVPVREEAVVRDQPVVRETPVVREERVIREDPPRY